MIYTSGYFIAFLGLIIMLFNFKDLYPKLNIWCRLGFILLCLGLILPMLFGFITGRKLQEQVSHLDRVGSRWPVIL